MGDGDLVSACCCWGDSVYCLFMHGPAVRLDKVTGTRLQAIKVVPSEAILPPL
jgi:hypothetical protein